MARLQECPCGSGEYPDALQDGYGIFLCYACSKCQRKKVGGYRKDIFTRYATDEQIEDDY
jgi:cytochrome c551/c552